MGMPECVCDPTRAVAHSATVQGVNTDDEEAAREEA